MHVLHHIHRRKRGTQKHDSILLDKIICAVAIISPFMTIPQIYLVWIKNEVAGISIFTWTAYSFFNLIWVFYGLSHKDKPIVICNTLWIIVQGLVVLGVLIFK